MRIIERILWILLICSTAYAGRIKSPPPLPSIPKDLNFYLKEIESKINIYEITDSAPNGNRNGDKGEPIIYNNGGTFELWINTDSSTTWQQI